MMIHGFCFPLSSIPTMRVFIPAVLNPSIHCSGKLLKQAHLAFQRDFNSSWGFFLFFNTAPCCFSFSAIFEIIITIVIVGARHLLGECSREKWAAPPPSPESRRTDPSHLCWSQRQEASGCSLTLTSRFAVDKAEVKSLSWQFIKCITFYYQILKAWSNFLNFRTDVSFCHNFFFFFLTVATDGSFKRLNTFIFIKATGTICFLCLTLPETWVSACF